MIWRRLENILRVTLKLNMNVFMDSARHILVLLIEHINVDRDKNFFYENQATHLPQTYKKYLRSLSGIKRIF